MDDWNDRLKRSPFRGSRPNLVSTVRGRDPIDVVIGIDFGTRFTKIAVGRGSRRSVWEDERKQKLFPSVVSISSDGTVTSFPERAPAGSEKIEYIKMLLADPTGEVFRSVRPRITGKPISDFVRPLAAKYLANLISRVRVSELRAQADLKDRQINWYVNVGAPASHCDSRMDAFKEVAAVAFAWSMQATLPTKLNELCSHYRNTAAELDLSASPASIVPELTAGLHEFVRDPNRADSLYGFFDIGGGTVDGAMFRINRSSIGLPLQIHAARVDHCGTMALSRAMLAELYSKLPQYIERPLIGGDKTPTIAIPLNQALAFRNAQSAYEEIQNLVGGLVATTKRQLYGRMFSPRVGANEKDTASLRVFIAGGGALSGWYRSAIEETFRERNLAGLGLTGLHTEIVRKPVDYQHEDYPRFVIALGLAEFSTALVDARLPSQFQDAQTPPARQLPDLITKDQV
jgi:hypothetical protein